MNKARSWRRYLMPVLIAGCAIIPCLNQNVYAEDTVPVTAVSAETAAKAKDYFDVLVNITEALNGTKCEQIQRDLRVVNHPENRRKMDFDISSLSGAASQEISKQYESKIRDYQTANKNFLNVCKSDPAARLANADLNDLFKKSVAKANLMAEKQKHDIALAEAEKAKYEAEKTKAQAARAQAEADKAKADAAKAESQANPYAYIIEQNKKKGLYIYNDNYEPQYLLGTTDIPKIMSIAAGSNIPEVRSALSTSEKQTLAQKCDDAFFWDPDCASRIMLFFATQLDNEGANGYVEAIKTMKDSGLTCELVRQAMENIKIDISLVRSSHDLCDNIRRN